MDTPKSGQPPYNGHTVHPLPIYCPYISTSEEGTTSENVCPNVIQRFHCYVIMERESGVHYIPLSGVELPSDFLAEFFLLSPDLIP